LDQLLRKKLTLLLVLLTKLLLKLKTKEDASKQPRIVIVDENGEPLVVPGTKRQAVYRLPVGSHITVNEGTVIDGGNQLLRFNVNLQRQKILPVVFHVLLSFSKQESLLMQLN
jgi:hypothetical protein